MKPHKHADLIKAWADGAEIQVRFEEVWTDTSCPAWSVFYEYRIKPSPKEVTVYYYEYSDGSTRCSPYLDENNCSLTVYKKTITLTEDDQI